MSHGMNTRFIATLYVTPRCSREGRFRAWWARGKGERGFVIRLLRVGFKIAVRA